MRMTEYINKISEMTEKAAALVSVLHIAGSGESTIHEDTLQWYTAVLEDLLDQIKKDTYAMTKAATAQNEN